MLCCYGDWGLPHGPHGPHGPPPEGAEKHPHGPHGPDWGLGPIPNPQSPFIFIFFINILNNCFLLLNYLQFYNFLSQYKIR